MEFTKEEKKIIIIALSHLATSMLIENKDIEQDEELYNENLNVLYQAIKLMNRIKNNEKEN